MVLMLEDLLLFDNRRACSSLSAKGLDRDGKDQQNLKGTVRISTRLPMKKDRPLVKFIC